MKKLALAMTAFVGTQMISAVEMTRGEYNEYREWKVPENENPTDEGYLLENKELTSNDERHVGYISWLPKNEFEKIYCAEGHLTFSQALDFAKNGELICRKGWNGKNQYVLVIKGDCVCKSINECYGDDEEKMSQVNVDDALYLKNAQDTLIPWVPSQGDLFAEDWCMYWNTK